MIVLKKWRVVKRMGIDIRFFEGWFLFGVIPLYIRQVNFPDYSD